MKNLVSGNPHYKKLGFGLGGFMLGMCAIAIWASMEFYNRSVELVRASYDLTATAPSLTPSPIPSPTPPARIYEDLFLEVKSRIYADPSGGIQKLEPLLQQDISILDLAHAHTLIAEAHTNLGNLEQATRSQEQIVALLEPSLDSFTSPEDIAEAYAYLMSAVSWLGDFESLGTFERQLSERFEPALESLDTALEIAEAYTALIGFYSWLGDYDQVKLHANNMFLKIDPLLPGLTTVREITIVYQYLISAAQYGIDDVELYLVYIDQLIEQLAPFEYQTEDPEELIIIFSYLGNAEFARGRHQISAAYYRKLIQYERNAANLHSLAYTYYLAGDNNCAYHWYQEYLMGEGPEYELHKQSAEAIIVAIEKIYGERIPDCK